MPQYSEEGFKAAKELIILMDEIAEKYNATMAQISLSWMISKKEFIIPITGTTKIKNMKSNFGAGNIKLDTDELKEIDELLDKINVPVFGGHGAKD